MVMLKKCKTKECQKIASATTEGRRKRRRQCKRWRDGVEEGLHIIGIKYRQVMSTEREE